MVPCTPCPMALGRWKQGSNPEQKAYSTCGRAKDIAVLITPPVLSVLLWVLFFGPSHIALSGSSPRGCIRKSCAVDEPRAGAGNEVLDLQCKIETVRSLLHPIPQRKHRVLSKHGDTYGAWFWASNAVKSSKPKR